MELEANEGMRKLEYASWLEPQWPSAAASLPEGLSELFTVSRLGLSRPLRRCLTTTNVIDSLHAGVRQQTNHFWMLKAHLDAQDGKTAAPLTRRRRWGNMFCHRRARRGGGVVCSVRSGGNGCRHGG